MGTCASFQSSFSKATVYYIEIVFMRWSVLIVIILVASLVYYFQSFREGYQSVTDCEALGYPHDFCLRIPLEGHVKPTYVQLVPGSTF